MKINEQRLACFGYSFFFAMPVLIGVKLSSVNFILMAISLTFLLFGILAPARIQKLIGGLNFIFSKLQGAFSQIFLFIFYYLIITPASFLMRIMGRDLISLKINKSLLSYWKKPIDKRSREQFFKDPF